MTKSLTITLPPKLEGFFSNKARYRVLYGGRGSGKSWAFAAMLLVKACEKKRRILCARELQKSIKDSSHRLIAETINRIGMQEQFEVGESYIRHRHNGSDFIFKGLKHNPDEIKSTEGIDIAWIEEAHRITKRSFDLLTPTVRKEGSELWFSFNPDDEEDEIYQRFVINKPPDGSKILKINWDDNPYFPKELNQERLYTLSVSEEDYKHIWEGEVKKAKEGAYYAKQLAELREQGKITHIPYNPNFPVDTYWDIGMSDYTSIWFIQKIGAQFLILDFYQNNNEDIEHYANILQKKGYLYKEHYLPFDADHLRLGMGGYTVAQQLDNIVDADVLTVRASKNINNDINNSRSFLLRCAFDANNCEEGLKSLRNYKKKWDDNKNCFADKPLHDEHSHAADAFRYLAINNITENDIVFDYNYGDLVNDRGQEQVEVDFELSSYI